MGNVIELRKVDKIYYGAVNSQVLFSIDLKIEEGSLNSVIGESGSGKTTLLNLIGTLDRPTNGDVLIDGNHTKSLNNNELAELRNKTIGFVFQFHYLLPEFTALENVLIPYLIQRPKLDNAVLQRSNELFETLGIFAIKNNLVTKMSGGQQQRTAIARALINNPKIILADEPTGNLDSENTETIYRIFRQLNEKYKTTFVIITHDRRIAENTDRILEIKDGRIVLDTGINITK
ncbi:ABC transporter ATP-binding protein [Chloroflexota bacterium]